jgi:hypothetical protein
MENSLKYNVLDTAFFIKLKPLETNQNWKYYTTEYIIQEIRDEKVGSFYNFLGERLLQFE